MDTKNAVLLNHSLSLLEIAERIRFGNNKISLKEVSSDIIRCCPDCRETLVLRPHKHWFDAIYDERLVDLRDKYVYTDLDTIYIQEVAASYNDGTYKYLDLDATMMAGHCPFCGETFGLVQVFCFGHVPHPSEGAKGNPGDFALCDFRYDLFKSVEENKLYVIYLGDVPIGSMGFGKNVYFKKSLFAGYPTEDFVSDCCAFCLDCVSTESQLDDSPIGVVNGHYDMNDTEDDWDAAAIVTKALYQAGKEFMNQVETP